LHVLMFIINKYTSWKGHSINNRNK
jgi:hypothetical protein